MLTEEGFRHIVQSSSRRGVPYRAIVARPSSRGGGSSASARRKFLTSALRVAPFRAVLFGSLALTGGLLPNLSGRSLRKVTMLWVSETLRPTGRVSPAPSSLRTAPLESKLANVWSVSQSAAVLEPHPNPLREKYTPEQQSMRAARLQAQSNYLIGTRPACLQSRLVGRYLCCEGGD